MREWGTDEVRVDVAIRTLPLFIKAGAIIPTGPVMQYASQCPLDAITLLVYPYGETDFQLYEDDGETYAYEHGTYRLTQYRSRVYSNTTEIFIKAPVGSFEHAVDVRDYTLRIAAPRRAAAVRVNDCPWPYRESGQAN